MSESITIRFRSPQGQFNYKVAKKDSLVKLLTEVGNHFQMKAARFATRIYHDRAYEQRIIKQNFAQTVTVDQFFKQNGQIVYVKPQAAQEAYEESQPEKTNEKPSMEDIFRMTLKPDALTPNCNHPTSMVCSFCMKAQE